MDHNNKKLSFPHDHRVRDESCFAVPPLFTVRSRGRPCGHQRWPGR